MTADSRWMGRGWMSERGGVPADARRAGDAPSFAVFTSESTGLETTTAYNDVAGQKRKKKQTKNRQTDRQTPRPFRACRGEHDVSSSRAIGY